MFVVKFLSYLLLALCVFATNNTKDLCLWNYKSSSGNNQLNGLYKYNGTYYYYDYYIMPSSGCDPALYLYRRYNYWLISTELGSSSYLAKCNLENIDTPTSCNNYWLFTDANNTVDTSVIISYAPCPSLTCGQLSLYFNSSDPHDICSGTFSTKVSDNVYSRDFYLIGAESPITQYLYFNEKAFKWVCYNKVNETSCFSSYENQENPEWVNISIGQSMELSWSNSYVANITCLEQSPSTTSMYTTTQATTIQPHNATDEDLCLWYRGSNDSIDSYIYLNGQYIFNGTYNFHNYYYMNSPDSCDSKELYLYYVAEGAAFHLWYIGETLGSFSYLARCTITDLNTPIDCNGNWEFADANSVDKTVDLSIAPCPVLNCSLGVKFEYVNINNDVDDPDNYDDSCIGEFYAPLFANFNDEFRYNLFVKRNRYITKNLLVETDYDIYFYFNEKDFRWVCSPEYNSSSCYNYYGIDLNREWFEINDNTSHSINITWFNGKTHKDVKLSCLSEQDNSLNITYNYDESKYTLQPTSSSYNLVTPSPTPSVNNATNIYPFTTQGGNNGKSGSNKDNSNLWWTWLIVSITVVTTILVLVYSCRRRQSKTDAREEQQGLLENEYHKL